MVKSSLCIKQKTTLRRCSARSLRAKAVEAFGRYAPVLRKPPLSLQKAKIKVKYSAANERLVMRFSLFVRLGRDLGTVYTHVGWL